MTANTILAPDLLFISEEKWNNEETRDRFLEKLSDYIRYIELFSLTIFWTDELSERMWSSPQMPPWRMNRDWSNQLIPIIFNKLSTRQQNITCKSNIKCKVEPSLSCDCNLALDLSLILVNNALLNELDFSFCLGIINNNTAYIFSSPEHSDSYAPICIGSSQDWFDNINIEHVFWPSNRNEESILKKCIELTHESEFIDNPILYSYRFSRNFISDLIGATSKKHIVNMICKRLTLTTQESSKDRQLQDEFILQTKERRFRVKQRPSSTRIHYEISDGSILFKRYYAEGHHDEGL